MREEHELQLGGRSLEGMSRQETVQERYGADWARDIGEPMVCEYMEQHFDGFRRVLWTSDIPNGLQLEHAGVDGIVVFSDEEEDEPHCFGIQLSTAALHTRQGQEVWLKKMRRWKEHPVRRMGDEAEVVGALKGDSLPVLFVQIDRGELETAWDSTPHGDWKEKEATEAAREAAAQLPESPQFRQKMIDSLWLSLEIIGEIKPEMRSALTPHRDILEKERRRIDEEKGKNSDRRSIAKSAA